MTLAGDPQRSEGQSCDCQSSQRKKFWRALENADIFLKIFRCLIVFQFPDHNLPEEVR